MDAVFKICLNGDVRRKQVSMDTVTYSFLCEMFNKTWGEELPDHYQLQYLDDEGDRITITDDGELVEGLRVFKDMAKIPKFEAASPGASKDQIMLEFKNKLDCIARRLAEEDLRGKAALAVKRAGTAISRGAASAGIMIRDLVENLNNKSRTQNPDSTDTGSNNGNPGDAGGGIAISSEQQAETANAAAVARMDVPEGESSRSHSILTTPDQSPVPSPSPSPTGSHNDVGSEQGWAVVAAEGAEVDFSNKMKQLTRMGFMDNDKNKEVLSAAKGDVDVAVAKLLVNIQE